MSRDNAAPFERGATFYNGGSIDSNNLQGGTLLGQTKDFEDKPWSDFGAKGSNSGHLVTCMLVRNLIAGAVTPGQAVELDPANPFTILRTAQTVNGPYVIVDEFLPSAGCPQYDICWVVIHGPCSAKITPGNSSNIAAGAYVGADSTATGTLVPHTLSTATDAFNDAMNSSWAMGVIAKNAGVVNGRIFVCSRYW